MFKDHMSFSAEQHFTKKGIRRYSEICWSTFWWEIQVYIQFYPLYINSKTNVNNILYSQDKLESGATIIPILLGIDETYVNLLGCTKVHPLYITIGNIHKKIRQTYSRNAYQVLAYFPVLEGTKHE